jgi:hypothetical protein
MSRGPVARSGTPGRSERAAPRSTEVTAGAMGYRLAALKNWTSGDGSMP